MQRNLVYSILVILSFLQLTQSTKNERALAEEKTQSGQKSFNVEKFRCILKVIYQRILDEDIEEIYFREQKQDKLTDNEKEKMTAEDVRQLDQLDSYLIKLRGFLKERGEFKDLNPLTELSDVNFVRLFNQLFIDFNNFKEIYKEQVLACGLESVLQNTEKRCRNKYGPHCELNENQVSFGVKCPEGYIKYKNFFCFIKCPEPYIDYSNSCMKPPHIKVDPRGRITQS